MRSSAFDTFQFAPITVSGVEVSHQQNNEYSKKLSNPPAATNDFHHLSGNLPFSPTPFFLFLHGKYQCCVETIYETSRINIKNSLTASKLILTLSSFCSMTTFSFWSWETSQSDIVLQRSKHIFLRLFSM